jgi:CTP:molybdopterin cytidylyltransferase MocA
MPVIDGLLLAAGYSSRMGEFKPLLEHNGLPFAVGIAQKMSRVCRRVVVVLGYRSDDIRAAFASQAPIETLELVENPRFDQGMFTSLQVGIAALKDVEWALYHFADQPHLPEEFYTEFVRCAQGEFDSIQPVHRGRKGHPLLLNRSLFAPIQSAPPDRTLRDAIRESHARVNLWGCPFPQVLHDFDTPGDLERP